jgi:energy-coupling factor transporter ATP-binding protein EcfA2
MSQDADWLSALTREAAFRAGLVLYGNTRDLFWSGVGSEYLTLPTLLARRLDSFTVRAAWDRVDGLQFADEREARRWDEAVKRAVAEPVDAGSAYDLGDEDEDEPAQVGPRRLELNELIAQYRRVLAAPGIRPLLVIDWSHLLITQPAHPDPAEREWLLQLGKALVGEPTQRIDSDQLRQGTGLVVLVSASLGTVPPILYQGEPRVRLLTVPAPGREERRSFFERHADDVQVDAPRVAPGATPVPARKATVEALADLTDQLTTADLRQVVGLSRSLERRLLPDRLLNLYRFGDQRSPWEELSEDKLASVDAALKRRVIGQDTAVDHVATMIIRAWLGLAGLQHSARRSKPKGTLFFVGPTGVGKTELAKACAEFLFGDESACIRFDMSEYNHEHSDQRLVGAPPGYVGFEEGGQLTNAVRARPFSVLLFDEIEKAHGRVLDKFLQILEDGRLTDGRGETAWFSETIIIFTSNIGAADVPKDATSSSDYERHFRGAVEQHFVRELGRPELLNRLGDNIVVFRSIHDAAFRRSILDRKMEPLRAHMMDRWGVKLEVEEEVLDRLVQVARLEHGGRGLLNAVERELLNPMARFLFERHGKLRRGRVVLVHMDGKLIEFELRDG